MLTRQHSASQENKKSSEQFHRKDDEIMRHTINLLNGKPTLVPSGKGGLTIDVRTGQTVLVPKPLPKLSSPIYKPMIGKKP